MSASTLTATCPDCGSNSVDTVETPRGWQFGFCHDCGLDAEAIEPSPNMPSDEEWREERQAEYDEHDPGQSFGEESRRAHEREF